MARGTIDGLRNKFDHQVEKDFIPFWLSSEEVIRKKRLSRVSVRVIGQRTGKDVLIE